MREEGVRGEGGSAQGAGAEDVATEPRAVYSCLLHGLKWMRGLLCMECGALVQVAEPSPRTPLVTP